MLGAEWRQCLAGAVTQVGQTDAPIWDFESWADSAKIKGQVTLHPGGGVPKRQVMVNSGVRAAGGGTNFGILLILWHLELLKYVLF